MNNNELMYTCNSCGAKLKNNTKNRLIECPYCKSDIVFLEKGIDKYNIKKIIPFNIPKEKVKNQEDGIFLNTKNIEIESIYLPCYFGTIEYDCNLYGEKHFFNEKTDITSNKKCVTKIQDKIKNVLFTSYFYETKNIKGLDFIDLSKAIPFEPSKLSTECRIDDSDNYNFKEAATDKIKAKIDHGLTMIKTNIDPREKIRIIIKELNVDKEAVLIPIYKVRINKIEEKYILGTSHVKLNLTMNNRRKDLIYFILGLLIFNSISTIVYLAIVDKATKYRMGIDKCNIMVVISFILIILSIYLMVKAKKKTVIFDKIKIDNKNNKFFYDEQVK